MVARLALGMYKLRLSIVSNSSVGYNAHSIGNEPKYRAVGTELACILSIDRHSLDLAITFLEQ